MPFLHILTKYSAMHKIDGVILKQNDFATDEVA